jgi:hypothetical protein
LKKLAEDEDEGSVAPATPVRAKASVRRTLYLEDVGTAQKDIVLALTARSVYRPFGHQPAPPGTAPIQVR